MERFLLDTNVISEGTSKTPNARVLKWINGLAISQTYISVMTVGEIRKGIELSVSPQKRAQLEYWLSHEVKAVYRERILAVDQGIAERWGEIMAQYKNNSMTDMLLAATALVHDLILVTRNTRHFSVDDLRLFNPWHE